MRAEEQREEEAERIAEALNEESFKVPQVPLRRSVRITKATSRYTDQPTVKDYDNNFLEVSNKCHINHKGLYCADKEVDHFPDYYDSSENVITFLFDWNTFPHLSALFANMKPVNHFFFRMKLTP